MNYIPESWEIYKLKDICIIGDGAHASIKRMENGILYLTSKNFGVDRLNLNKADYISEEDYKRYFNKKSKALTTPESGDVLLGIIGTIGSPYLVKKNDLFGLSSSVSIIRPNSNKVYPSYLYYWFKTPLFQGALNQIKSGVAQSFLSLAMIGSLPCAYPKSLPTQQKIAQILSAYDDLIENNLKRIKLLEEMAQITYEQWFVRLKFPNHETTPIDTETGLPEGWAIVKVGNLLDKMKVTKKIKSSEYLDNGKIPIIDQSRKFIAGYTDNEDSKIESREPIIVFGDHTRILKLINFTFARGADGTQIIKSKDNKIPQHQFYLALLTIDLSDYHYARHFKFLKESLVIVPTKEVAIEFEDKAESIFNTVKLLRDKNTLLKEARDILLPRLMTGIIDVDKITIPSLKADTESKNA